MFTYLKTIVFSNSARGVKFDPIPSPEELFICSQSYFCFQLVWVLAPIRRIVQVSDHT